VKGVSKKNAGNFRKGGVGLHASGRGGGPSKNKGMGRPNGGATRLGDWGIYRGGAYRENPHGEEGVTRGGSKNSAGKEISLKKDVTP